MKKKLIFLKIFFLFNVVYAANFYSVNDMVTYDELQREISGIGIINDKVRIEKLYLGETNPVVTNKIAEKVKKELNKKLEIITLRLSSAIRKMEANLNKSQEEKFKEIINKLLEYKSKIAELNFKVEKLQIDNQFIHNEYQRFISKYDLLRAQIDTILEYINKEGYILNPEVKKLSDKEIENIIYNSNCEDGNCNSNNEVSSNKNTEDNDNENYLNLVKDYYTKKIINQNNIKNDKETRLKVRKLFIKGTNINNEKNSKNKEKKPSFIQ